MAALRGSTQPPSYNKYSGIQEWLNAIAFFVNVAPDGRNLFFGGGRRMLFFASDKQTEETPVIARVLATRAEAGGAQHPQLLLFCRLVRRPPISRVVAALLRVRCGVGAAAGGPAVRVLRPLPRRCAR